jgi:hypothetical protein
MLNEVRIDKTLEAMGRAAISGNAVAKTDALHMMVLTLLSEIRRLDEELTKLKGGG